MVWEASLLGPCVQISENKSIKTFVNSDLPGPPREGLAWKSVEKLLKECKDNLESLTLMGIRCDTNTLPPTKKHHQILRVSDVSSWYL